VIGYREILTGSGLLCAHRMTILLAQGFWGVPEGNNEMPPHQIIPRLPPKGKINIYLYREILTGFRRFV
jgi:hypothetical protein